jgi:hypothetical protein
LKYGYLLLVVVGWFLFVGINDYLLTVPMEPQYQTPLNQSLFGFSLLGLLFMLFGFYGAKDLAVKQARYIVTGYSSAEEKWQSIQKKS